MKAKSADYIKLQNIYKSKARKDIAEVLATVREQEDNLGRTKESIEEKEVDAFCKGAAFVKLVRGKPSQTVHNKTGKRWGDRAKFACKPTYFNHACCLISHFGNSQLLITIC